MANTLIFFAVKVKVAFCIAKAIHIIAQEVVGCVLGVVYLTSLGRPTDIGLQLGKDCYPCSR